MEKKGQIATEYLILVGVVLAILLPALVIWGVYTIDSQQTSNRIQAQEAAQNIVKRAENIYYLGEGSQDVVQVRVPRSVKGIYVMKYDGGGGEVTFILTGPQGQDSHIVARSRVPITYGKDEDGSEIHFSTEEGIRDFKIVSMGRVVCITTVSGICPKEDYGPGPEDDEEEEEEEDEEEEEEEEESITCEEMCEDSNMHGSCLRDDQAGQDQTCTSLTECAGSSLMGRGYNLWHKIPESEDPCTSYGCWCHRTVCCTNTQTCPAGTSECIPISPPEDTRYVGIATCTTSPYPISIIPRGCGESDGICPLDFSEEFSTGDIEFCCLGENLDPDCVGSPQC